MKDALFCGEDEAILSEMVYTSQPSNNNAGDRAQRI